MNQVVGLMALVAGFLISPFLSALGELEKVLLGLIAISYLGVLLLIVGVDYSIASFGLYFGMLALGMVILGVLIER